MGLGEVPVTIRLCRQGIRMSARWIDQYDRLATPLAHELDGWHKVGVSRHQVRSIVGIFIGIRDQVSGDVDVGLTLLRVLIPF